MIIIDAIMIFTDRQYFINQLFSMFELAWFLFSVLQFYFASKAKENVSIILAYLIYYIFSWFVGSYLLASQGNLNNLPPWFLIFAMSFGGFYTLICIKQYKKN